MSGPPIKVRSALGCDDIREEANGKFIAVGLFGPVLSLVPERTSGDGDEDRTFRAHFLLSVDVLATGEHKLEFRLRRGSGGGGTARLTVQFEAVAENVPFPLGPMTLRVPEGETELTLAIKDGERWKRISSWSIETAAQPRPEPRP